MAMTQEQFEEAREREHLFECYLEEVDDGFPGDFEDYLIELADRAERRDEERAWQAGCGPLR